MKICVDIDTREILREIGPQGIAEYIWNHGDIVDFLRVIPLEHLISHIREHHSIARVLEEMAEVGDVESHIADLQAWVDKQKKQKEVG